MNKIKNGKYEDNEEKKLLAYLAKQIKEVDKLSLSENVTASEIKREALEYCNLNKDDENDDKQKQMERIENLIELLFAPEKKYVRCVYGFFGCLLLQIILLIIMATNPNSYLLIFFFIAFTFAVFFVKQFLDRRRFNSEKRRFNSLIDNCDYKDLYTKKLENVDYPYLDQINNNQNRLGANSNNDYQPKMEQVNPNILDDSLRVISSQN